MKKILFLILFNAIYIISYSQVSKSSKIFSSQIASKYAKNFAKKFYESPIIKGDYKSNFKFNIIDWGVIIVESEQCIVKVKISWQENFNGIFKNTSNLVFEGIMAFDEFGCQALLFIVNKSEPESILTKSNTIDLDDNFKNNMPTYSNWFNNIKWGWAPKGCLD